MNRCWGCTMKRAEFEQMSVDHLWKLRAEISAILAAKIGEEKQLIEERLIRLRANSRQGSEGHESERRPYPRVFPKFRHPDDFSQPWPPRATHPPRLTSPLKSHHTRH